MAEHREPEIMRRMDLRGIDNRYYDPEADWAGWMTGVYGYSSYPIRHYVKKVYNFMR